LGVPDFILKAPIILTAIIDGISIDYDNFRKYVFNQGVCDHGRATWALYLDDFEVYTSTAMYDEYCDRKWYTAAALAYEKGVLYFDILMENFWLFYQFMSFPVCNLIIFLAIFNVFLNVGRYLKWKFVGNDYYGYGVVTPYVAFLMRLVAQPRLSASLLRSSFSSMIMVTPKKLQNNHTHPEAAAVRNASSEQAQLFANMVGMKAYYIQMSNSDVRSGKAGMRSYHWGKDLSVNSQPYKPPPNSINVMIDVDMYLNMPAILANDVKPYILSTFQPQRVAGNDNNIAYTFNENNEVIFNVSGGAQFSHKIWNYNADVLLVRTMLWDGWRQRSTIYNIDKRQISDMHQLILLTPVKTVVSILFHPKLEGKELSRMSLVNGEVLSLNVMTPDGMKRSIGAPGKFACALIDATDDDTVALYNKVSKTDLSIAQVKTILKTDDPTTAAAVVNSHRSMSPAPGDYVCPVTEAVKHYSFDVKSLDPKETMMHAYMSPLYDNAFGPCKSMSDEKQAIQGRIIDAKTHTPVTTHLVKILEEFVNFLVPIAHLQHPVDQDVVFERMNKPSQRNILHNGALDCEPDACVKSFLKAECYSDVKDPRIISTVEPHVKYKYAHFIYAFNEHVMKLQDWYAFSKTPVQIAQRVAKILARANKAIVTDFHRFDGHLAELMRLLERMAMMRTFRIEYHEDLLEIMEKQKFRNAKMPNGSKYVTGTARLSGSQETSDFNSVENAATAYVALRSEKINGDYRTPDEAWAALGIYGGDDGITADVGLETYVKASASMGQVMTSEVIMRFQSGIKFLARIYSPEVWCGSLNSMCDVARQLGKLHVTHKLPDNVLPLTKLHEKCMGYYLTDKNTPIIGELSSYVVNHLGKKDMKHGIANYFSRYPENVQYPNEYEQWMDDQILLDLPTLDRTRFKRWLSTAWENQAMLSPPVIVETPPIKSAKVPVIVGDDKILPVVIADVKVGVPKRDKKNPRQKTRSDQWKKSKAKDIPNAVKH